MYLPRKLKIPLGNASYSRQGNIAYSTEKSVEVHESPSTESNLTGLFSRVPLPQRVVSFSSDSRI